jgi:L-ascorbate metabolism protein UlaG (beta-lactamase superfamily)
MQLNFQWIGGATFILTIADLKIAVDPVLCPKGTIQNYFWFKSKRLEAPIYNAATFDNVDLWLITHNHEDHLDEIGLSKINDSAHIISNSNSLKKLKQKSLFSLTVLKWNEQTTVQIKEYTIQIKAIPAIHGVNPLSALFAGKVNGYYLTISKNNEKKYIYISSDTVYKTKIIQALVNKPIDLMIPNMGAAKQGSWIMTLTLNSKMLQKMLTKLKPKIVIPVHYGTFEHYKEPLEKIKQLDDKRIKIVAVGANRLLDL